MVGSTSSTSISVTNETAQVLNALKTKRRLQSIEATMHWLFASLDAEGKKEMALITDFLALPPPFINIEEVVKEFSYSYVDVANAKDLVFAKVVAEKINPSEPGQSIDKVDISDVIDKLIQEKIDYGLARSMFVNLRLEIVDHVFKKLNQEFVNSAGGSFVGKPKAKNGKTTKSPMERIIHDKPGVEHGENTKPGKDQDQST